MRRNVLVQLNQVAKHFLSGLSSRQVKAVDGVSLDIFQGESLGLVGESGCGKSTLGRVILRLTDITSGQVLFQGQDVFKLRASELAEQRKQMQLIFQDPCACLNPRLRIEDIIAEPLKFHRKLRREQIRERVCSLMDEVGLQPDMGRRFAHGLSGGQQQRVGIARALVLQPKFLVCDEPVSALDVSVQAQILNLLVTLKEKRGLTYLFISHNLSVVHHLCDRIAVMYLGRIVELADKDTLFCKPLHPYTQGLMSAMLTLQKDPQRQTIELLGDIPSPMNPPAGCSFCPRCPHAQPICREKAPGLQEIESRHFVACHCIPSSGR